MYKLFLFNKSSSNMDVNAPKVDESKEKINGQQPHYSVPAAVCFAYLSVGERVVHWVQDGGGQSAPSLDSAALQEHAILALTRAVLSASAVKRMVSLGPIEGIIQGTQRSFPCQQGE